jgi:hypothetical protein
MTITPITEGMPAPADRDFCGRCWWGCPSIYDPETGERQSASWVLAERPFEVDTHWARHDALPVIDPLMVDAPEDDHPSMSAAERNPSLVGAR